MFWWLKIILLLSSVPRTTPTTVPSRIPAPFPKTPSGKCFYAYFSKLQCNNLKKERNSSLWTNEKNYKFKFQTEIWRKDKTNLLKHFPNYFMFSKIAFSMKNRPFGNIFHWPSAWLDSLETDSTVYRYQTASLRIFPSSDWRKAYYHETSKKGYLSSGRDCFVSHRYPLRMWKSPYRRRNW